MNRLFSIWMMASVAAACSSGAAFGECCVVGDDCDSGACGLAHGACTLACNADADCPPEPKNGVPSCKAGLCQAEQDGDICAPSTSDGAGAGGPTSAGAGGSVSCRDTGDCLQGEPCESNYECFGELICNVASACDVRQPIGAPCDSSTQCLDGLRCDKSQSPHQCAPD